MQTNETTAHIIAYLLSRQPPSIRERLNESEGFGKEQGLRSSTVLSLGGSAAIDSSELISAVLRVLAKEVGEAEFVAIEGTDAAVCRNRDNHLILRINRLQEAALEVEVDELLVLSPDPRERIQALSELLIVIGPAARDFSALEETAQERPLRREEVLSLMEELWGGVSSVERNLRRKLRRGEAVLEDLAVPSLDFIERFLGPDPGEVDPDVYLTSILPQYRRKLLARNFNEGLRLCLLGCLRDDLSPGPWVEAVSDDELWNAVQSCRPELDPFSLLASLDVSLYRQRDSRFASFASDAVALLIKRTNGGLQSPLTDQLIPALSGFVYNRMVLLDGGMLRPPFWKRAGAWMYGTLVARMFSGVETDGNELVERLQSGLNRAGEYARILDLRREPRSSASFYTLARLRAEIVSRLVLVKHRHLGEGRSVPREEEIDEALLAIARELGPQEAFSPGPLEGHIRLGKGTEPFPERVREGFLSADADFQLPLLAHLVQLFDLDEDLRSVLFERIGGIRSSREVGEDDRLVQLEAAGLVAASARDEEAAEAVAGSLLGLASGLQDASAVRACSILVLASAAFEEERTSMRWLEQHLSRLATNIRPGRGAAILFRQLQELKRMVPMHLGNFGQAEAIASSAAE